MINESFSIISNTSSPIEMNMIERTAIEHNQAQYERFVLLTKKQDLPEEDYLENHGEDKFMNCNFYIPLSISAHVLLWIIFCFYGRLVQSFKQ